MSQNTAVSKKPWYKNTWLLFLLAFPFASVLMGCVILYLAISRSDSVVQDNYYKEGLAINQEMAAIESARKKNIELQLSFTKGLVSIESTQPIAEETQQLRLLLSHNLNDKLDREVVLNRIDQFTFSATMNDLKKGRWYISVNPIHDDQLWRIKGKIYNQEQQTFLLTAKTR